MDNRELDAIIGECVMGLKGLELMREFLPLYSTNIQDAWLIVDKLKQEDQHYFELMNGDLKDYECHFSSYEAEADTAPMAICLAALKVVGVEVGL